MGKCNQIVTIYESSTLGYFGPPLDCISVENEDNANRGIKNINERVCDLQTNADLQSLFLVELRKKINLKIIELQNLATQISLCCSSKG